MRSYIFIKTVKQHLHETHLLTSVLRSSQRIRREPQQFRIIADPTNDRLRACSDMLSCTRSRTSGSSLVFPTLTLFQAMLLQAAASGCKRLQAVK